MTSAIEQRIEGAVIRGAERALRGAATRAIARAEGASDGAAAGKHMRDAALWAACANDVSAMKGWGDSRPDPEPDTPDPAPVDPSPNMPAGGGAAAVDPATGQRECA